MNEGSRDSKKRNTCLRWQLNTICCSIWKNYCHNVTCGTVTPGKLAGTNDSSVYRAQREACGLHCTCVSILVQTHTERALVSKRSANWKPQLTDTSKMTANSILAAVKVRVVVGSGSTQNWFHCSLRKIHSALSYYNKMYSVLRGTYHSPLTQQFIIFTVIHILRSKTNLHTYSNNYTIIRHNNTEKCGKPPTCLGLFRPSSGRYWTKKYNFF